MSYLLTQMFLYMLATFLLGLLLGWLLWRYGKASSGDMDALRAERAAIAKERDDLKVNLDACRTRSSQERATLDALRADKIDLQNRLDGMVNERNSFADVAMPAAAVAAVAAAPSAAPAAPAAATSSFAGTASKPEGLSAPRGGRADDLKEINGIGPAMEKMLHKLGYYHFDQVAKWSPSEEAWVNDNLEGFKGRVSRDDWIAQAKVLAGL